MTKPIRVLIAIMTSVVMAMVAGCGGAAADPAKNFVGSWQIAGMTEDGEAMAAEDLATLAEMGMEITLTFSDDGKFTLAMGDEELAGTWEAKDATNVALSVEGESVQGTLADGKLTLDQGEGSTLTFEKRE